MKTHGFALRCGVGVLIAAATLELTGCAKTVKPDGAARSVVDVVSRQTGFTPNDVRCPAGVKANVGAEFDCGFTGPEGPYVAHMRVTKVAGDDVEFDVKAQPGSPQPPKDTVHTGWKVAEFVVLLVLGIAAVQALIWIPIIAWWRRRSRAAKARLAAEIESETPIRPPEKGLYRGATAPGYPGVNNNGTIALTARRLVFITLTGKLIEIPVSDIVGVREAKVFKSSVRGGRSHLIVQLPSGEVAFYVASNADWIAAITALVKPRG
jgi:hypothetical protein